MMKKLFIAGALSCVMVASAAVKFPYPQTNKYDYIGSSNLADVWNCRGQTASSMLLDAFETYLKGYYEESGNQARIKFDESRYTVSEGIGYAMILCVYFSSNTKSYQTQFDKLWAYYQAHTNENGVMNWKIDGFGGAVGQNGATDAEEDVAFALAMAYYQFGDDKYKSAASSLIGKMRTTEFSSNGMHKLGDAWDPYKNPSYVSPAAYEIYKLFDSNSSFWDSAIKTNYEMLLKNQNSSTGIPSGWADNNSFAPIVGNNGYNFAGYDYDAVRAPWRWAWSYAWYGHSQAKTLSDKLAAWVNTKPFGQLYINMKTDGTASLTQEPCKSNGCKANGSSIGSLSSVLIMDEKYHAKLNENFGALLSQQPGYFHSNLRLLTGLLMTGNFPNMSKATPVTVPEFVVPDSCNAVEEVFQNSGAFGWNSTSVVLSNESNTGVQMNGMIQGEKREAYRAVDGVQAGQKYTLTFDAAMNGSPALYLTYGVYADDHQQDQLCGAMKKLDVSAPMTLSCEFTATSTPVYLTLILNNWDEPGVVISNLSLKDGSGAAIAIPEPVGFSAAKVDARPSLNVSVAGRIASVELSSQMAAQVSVMDMQGRVVVSSVKAEAGKAEVSLAGLRQGKYLVNVRQGASHWTRAIVVAE